MLKSLKGRIAFACSLAGAVLVVAVPAFAVDPDPATVVGGAASDLKSSLLSIATTVLPYAAVILAVTLGWRFARKFIRG
jgi:hypothetical protein